MSDEAPKNREPARASRSPHLKVTLGVRMTSEKAREAKVEAAARRMSVATLFDEIWQAYQAGRRKL
jgi:hypothetical protein